MTASEQNRTMWLIEAEVLSRVQAHQREREARRAAPLTSKQKLSLILTLAGVVVLMGVLIWWLESAR